MPYTWCWGSITNFKEPKYELKLGCQLLVPEFFLNLVYIITCFGIGLFQFFRDAPAS